MVLPVDIRKADIDAVRLAPCRRGRAVIDGHRFIGVAPALVCAIIVVEHGGIGGRVLRVVIRARPFERRHGKDRHAPETLGRGPDHDVLPRMKIGAT